jgi:acyl-CoA synthetase (NDP forming)
VTGSSGRSAPERTIQPLVEADMQGKPLAAFITPEAETSLTGLLAAGVAAFRTPESAADAIGAFCRWRRPRIDALARAPVTGAGRVLDEAASLALLASRGVPVPQTQVLHIGEAPDLPFAYPVVLKVLSDAVPHKTEAGGVILNIDGPDALIAASQRIKTSVEAHHPGLVVDRVLAAPMLSPVQEVLVGYRLDPQFGPVITLAPGGVMVGIHADDKAVRPAPIDRATAEEMIAAVPGLAPLRGHRGLPPGDTGALVDIIMAMGSLAEDPRTILEAEANPVMVMQTGAVAADALVTVAT